MRISQSGGMIKHKNLSEQLEDAFYGTMDKLHGIETISKLLSDVVIKSECQDNDSLDINEISSVIDIIRYVAKKTYSDVSLMREALDSEGVCEELKKFNSDDVIEDYTRRTLTAEEELADKKEFFSNYFKS